MLLDIPYLSQQCAPTVAVRTMQAIVRTESGGHPWFVNDNTSSKAFRAKSKNEAIALAQRLVASGHNVDMGLGQINSKNLTWLGLSIEQVFEPCTNLAAAAKVLSLGYKKASAIYGGGQRALLYAISSYNTGNGYSGFSNGYVKKVVQNAGSNHSAQQSTVYSQTKTSVLVEVGGSKRVYLVEIN